MSDSGTGSAAAQVANRGSEALARLRRGEITLDQYLDDRTERAVAHLVGRVSEERLEVVRETVRQQLVTNPVVAALVERATRQARPNQRS